MFNEVIQLTFGFVDWLAGVVQKQKTKKKKNVLRTIDSISFLGNFRGKTVISMMARIAGPLRASFLVVSARALLGIEELTANNLNTGVDVCCEQEENAKPSQPTTALPDDRI